MTKKQIILHFTLGPVQGFIADARRTRDLWAGSFLLSWLSGQAMAALVKEGGTIIFPEVEGDDLFTAIQEFRENKETARAPYVGSLPNRFKADVTNVTGDMSAGQICEKAIKEAWEKLTNAVWTRFFASISHHGHESKTIWDRQVLAFWDMNWVIGEEEIKDGINLDGVWLDQRKNWRTYYPTDAEGGDLCTLMGNLQEISGFNRLTQRDEQKTFYAKLREQKYVGSLNISDGERLCSIALVKRLFPLLDNIKDIIGWRPGGAEVNIINWPSVSYISAVPWLKGVKEHENALKAGNDYSNAVTHCIDGSYRGEIETKLFGLPNDTFFQLDGHLLHKDGILTWDEKEFMADTTSEREVKRKSLLDEYSKLIKAFPKAISKDVNTAPTEFYAVLIMDGDSIGSLIGNHADIIKTGLREFTKAVKKYFAPKNGNPANGVLIYAGGDDVLALVPLDTAIEAADALRKEYEKAFEKAIEEAKEYDGKPKIANFTLSGAIVFAQYKIPLSAVLKKAHHALDGIAKEQNGRDSLALVVMKPGGVAAQWVTCWSHNPLNVIQSFAKDRSEYSASFLYNLRERYSALFPKDDPKKDGEEKVEPHKNADPSFMEQDGLMRSLVKAEYAKGKGKDFEMLPQKERDNKIAPIMAIGQPLKRENGAAKPIPGFTFEGLLVAHFMSNEGRWRLQK